MRADRLLSIMLLLQVNRRVTARELARRLEVSERTIHRDMDALSAAGVPVVAERGSLGGWMLMEEYRTNLTGLTKTEIQTLFLTKPNRLLSDLGLDKASNAAAIKLLAALPSVSRADAEYARQRLYVDTASWNPSREPFPLLPVIQEAVWQERKVRFFYQRLDCESIERLADPLGLVAKGSVWYLVAAVENEIRSYRISSIRSIEVLNEPCSRPTGFDLETFWEQSMAKFKANLPRYQATVRVSPAIFPRLSDAGRFARIEQTSPPDEDGWREVVIRFDTEEIACEYMLSFGPQLDVLQPIELREKVIRLAQSVLDYYGQKYPSSLTKTA